MHYAREKYEKIKTGKKPLFLSQLVHEPFIYNINAKNVGKKSR